MFKRSDEKRIEDAETIIGPSVRVDGKFSGKGNVIVQGQVSGSVRTNEDVRIDEGAVVKASVDARNCTVAGEIHGNVKVRERLDMMPTAKIYGDVEAKTVSVGAGAVLNGKCMMQDATSPINAQDAVKPTGNGRPKNGRRAAELTA
jgi:cytoskeletal protein CcmA (bactofilin family)